MGLVILCDVKSRTRVLFPHWYENEWKCQVDVVLCWRCCVVLTLCWRCCVVLTLLCWRCCVVLTLSCWRCCVVLCCVDVLVLTLLCCVDVLVLTLLCCVDVVVLTLLCWRSMAVAINLEHKNKVLFEHVNTKWTYVTISEFCYIFILSNNIKCKNFIS